jgi:preprotein translocase subunit SecF
MQRIIGAGLGAIVTYVLLILFAGTAGSQTFLMAVLIGLVVTIAWPWIIALMVARRVRDQRREEIDREVQERLAQKSRDS